MAKVKIKNIKGEDLKDITLSEKVFGIEPNDVVLKQAIRLQLDATRQGTKGTKGVGEVSGSGKKPWRQKGTGRARVGQKRNPIWRGGGHAFSLSNRDFTFKTNKKTRVLALKSALTYKAMEKAIILIDSIELADVKTKDIINIMDSIKATGKVLFITKEDNANLFMACRNLGYAYAIMADEINVYDIVGADYLVVDEAALAQIEEALI